MFQSCLYRVLEMRLEDMSLVGCCWYLHGGVEEGHAEIRGLVIHKSG